MYMGVGAVGLGFAMIFFAWNGAANVDYPQGQIPFLISGGVGGLALVIVGAILIVVENARRDRASVTQRLDEMNASLEKLARVMVAQGNGFSADGMVVAGATSFHRGDCRLVQGRDEAERLSRNEAEERGLSPCRICKP